MKYKDRFPICISFVMNIVLAVIFICFVGGYFESNDDSGMSFIVEGIYGEKSAHLVFINIIIGKILKILYTFVPLVKWYVVFQYTGLFFSFTFLSYLLLKDSLKIKRLLLTLFVLIPFSYECYVSLQFTKTAGVLTATGFFGMFYVLKQKEKKRLYLIGALLALTGSMLRFQSFQIVSAVMCIIGIFVLIENNKDVERNIKVLYNNSKDYLLGFGIIFLLIFIFFIGDRMVYTNDNGWEYFLRYNDARYKLLDYGFPDWDINKAEYEKMGYTLEDIQMYSTWTFADFDKLSLDNMKEIAELNHTKKYLEV